MRKEDKEDEFSVPLKIKRLRTKRENKQKHRLKTLLHDSRNASEIADEAAEEDLFLPD